VRVRARNGNNIETGSTVIGERYTLIGDPEGLSFTVHTTTVEVVATGDIINLDKGNSGIYFQNMTTSEVSEWKTQNYWVSGFAPFELTANTTYQFTVKTKNGEGIQNEYINAVTTFTKIEDITGLIFESSANNINAKPVNVMGLSNISKGVSGWQIEIKDGVNDEITNS